MESVSDYLESNCTITDSQHGFRTGRSCVSNLVSFLDRVSESVDAGKVIDLIDLGLFHTDASIRSEHSRQTTGAYVYHCAFTLARVRALAEITRANVRVHSRCQRSARAFARVAEKGIGYF